MRSSTPSEGCLDRQRYSKPTRTPAPASYSGDHSRFVTPPAPMLKRAFRAAYRAFLEAYKEAFAMFKEGTLVGTFPSGGLPLVGWWASPIAPR